METKSWAGLRLLVVQLCALAIFMVGYLKPSYNWDVVGYVAATYHEDGQRGADLSERTYADLRRSMPEAAFRGITSGDYAAAVYRDPEALAQHMPFYRIRLVYLQIVKGVAGALSVSRTQACVITSAVFAALGTLLLGTIYRKTMLPILGFPLLLFVAGLVQVARLATPDALTCFAALWLVQLLMQAPAQVGRALPGLLLVALPAIRTDFVLLSLLLAAYMAYRSRSERWLAGVSAALALGVYALVNAHSQNYGWLKVFHFTLIQIDPYPAQLVVSRNPMDYIRAYQTGLLAFIGQAPFVVYLAAAYLCIRPVATGRMPGGQPALREGLVMALVAFVALHLMLFPVYWDRFFVFCFPLCILFVAERARALPQLSPRFAGY